MRPRTTCARGNTHTATTLLVLAISLAMVACSNGFAVQSVSGRTVTVGHSYGRTTIDGVPQRIAALGTQWLDAVEVLGVMPVGYVDSVSLATGGAPTPWEPPTLKDSGVVAIDGRGDVIVQVAALTPDLILAPALFADQQTFDRLSQIAPTVPNLRDTPVQSWVDQVNILGKVLGREDSAKSAIGNVNGRIEALAESNPELAGKSYVTVNLVSADSFVAQTDREDPSATLFRKLGMVIPENLAEQAGSAPRITLPPDRVGDLTADLLVLIGSPEVTEVFTGLPPYAGLPAVKKGSVVILDPAAGNSLELPSPLSLPYLIDRLEPALAAAAR